MSDISTTSSGGGHGNRDKIIAAMMAITASPMPVTSRSLVPIFMRGSGANATR